MRWVLRTMPVLVGVLVAALLLGNRETSAAPQAATPLAGTVIAKTEQIVLRGADGSLVGDDRALPPGDYAITVDDQANIHDFHLVGPGVDQATTIDFVGKTTWDVTLAPGLYRYFCDPHGNLGMMNQFYVGTKPAAPKLTAVVAKGGKITVKDATGPVTAKRQLDPGTYALAVVDRSKADDFHLRDNGGFVGYSRATGKHFVGTQHWTVSLRAGQTYTYLSDPRFVAAGYLVVKPLS